MKFLELKGIKKYFPIQKGIFKKTIGHVKAVDEVDFFVKKDQIVGIVGESGSGKSTLAKIALRFFLPDAGKIIFKGEDITRASESYLRKGFRKKVQMVFQDPYSSLNPKLTIKSTLMDGVKQSIGSQRERLNRIFELLSMVGLDESCAYKYPHEFSGGQRQRICIARAISVNPELLVCDEPVSALDVSVQAQIINLLLELKKEMRLSLVFISHDLNLVGYLCDFVYVMHNGKVVEKGEIEKVFESPAHEYTKRLLDSIPGKNFGKL